jgi:hypothetical protein
MGRASTVGINRPLRSRTRVRYRGVMTPAQLEELAERHSRLLHTVLYLPHPRDGYDAWRRKWGGVVDLVDEINRMVSVAG